MGLLLIVVVVVVEVVGDVILLLWTDMLAISVSADEAAVAVEVDVVTTVG